MAEKIAAVMTDTELAAFLRRDFPKQAHFVVDRVTDRGILLRLTPRPEDLRPGGSLLGAAIFNLADVAVYLAILSRIGPKALTVTTGASIDYMRKPYPGHDLLAEVELLKIGRALAVGEARLFCVGSDDIVARATMTFSVPPTDRNLR
jgi:uncharacterized protein (TIGR00369 family)